MLPRRDQLARRRGAALPAAIARGFFAVEGAGRKTSFIAGSLLAGFSKPQPPLSQTRTLPPLRSRRRRYGFPQLGQASGIGRAESVKSQAG